MRPHQLVRTSDYMSSSLISFPTPLSFTPSSRSPHATGHISLSPTSGAATRLGHEGQLDSATSDGRDRGTICRLGNKAVVVRFGHERWPDSTRSGCGSCLIRREATAVQFGDKRWPVNPSSHCLVLRITKLQEPESPASHHRR